METRLLVSAVLLLPFVVAPPAPVLSNLALSHVEGPSSKQAVLRAIDLAAGRGFFRRSVEVKASKQGDTVTVLLCCPTSNVMVTAGRKPLKRLWRVTFEGQKVKTEVLDRRAASNPFSRQFTKQSDRRFAQAVRAACSRFWEGKEFDAMEFAADVSRHGDGYFVTITYVPYTPDAFTSFHVSREGKVKAVERF